MAIKKIDPVAAQVGEDYATVYFDVPPSLDMFTVPYISQEGLELLGAMIERHNLHEKLVATLAAVLNSDMAMREEDEGQKSKILDDVRAVLTEVGAV